VSTPFLFWKYPITNKITAQGVTTLSSRLASRCHVLPWCGTTRNGSGTPIHAGLSSRETLFYLSICGSTVLLLDHGLTFNFLILYTVGKAPWKEDQPVVRPLPTTEHLSQWLMELPIVQPLKKISEYYGTRRFITVFTIALHWFLSWARSIQSIPSPDDPF
jgi:hypothetical protein